MTFSLRRSAGHISLLTFTSRVLGMVRDMAFSWVYGTGSIQSAFALAYQVPNLFRMLFGEGAISAASIPVLTERLHKDGQEAMAATSGRLVALLIAILTVLCGLGELIVLGLYLRYGEEPNSALTLSLTAVMLPFLMLICPVAILGGIMNVFGRFALPASMPIVLNVLLIGAAVLAPWLIPDDRSEQIMVNAYTVLIGGAIELGLVWWGVRRCGLRLVPRLDWHDPAIHKIARTMLPMMLGMGVIQLNTLCDSMIAWWFVVDEFTPGVQERPGTAILYFAQRLYQFPMGVFLVALATATFPALARHAAQDDLPGLSRTLSRGIRMALFIALPCLAGLILIREPLVRLLFARGAFRETPGADVRVAWAVAMYAAGLWAYGMNHLLTRSFYAMQDAKTPLKVSVSNVFLNLTLNLLLVHTSMREAGLALATAICAAVQVAVLLVLFHRRVGRLDWGLILPGLARTLLATAGMAAAVYVTGAWLHDRAGNMVQTAAMMAVGGASYAGLMLLMGADEAREMLGRKRQRTP